ncbi:MAG: endonuclease/exonuclease/phosphatase family protein [Nitrospirales bacterium]|nr:endonuclease/exonuclease/phosphatase family protein [Nitrospirales bacterium]
MNNLKILLALLLSSILLWSCTKNGERIPGPTNGSSQPAQGPETFTIVSYNAWHGLDAGEFWVTSTETPEQNAARLRFQVQQIANADADVVLLQEVNPLPQRAEEYVMALQELGLDYTNIHQVDACGIRISGERALIPGLNNGLAILAKRELQLKKIKGLKLSGDIGNCEDTSGMQLGELRYGLIGEITLPESSTKYLITSLHLHSGFETGQGFLHTLANFHEQGRFDRYPWFKWEIDKVRLRRISEVSTLMRELYRLCEDGAYAGMAIGGDFNFEPDFPEYEEAKLLRIIDSFTLAKHDAEQFTADPVRNGLIRFGPEPTIPNLLKRELSEVSPETKEAILVSYVKEQKRPRRIDYIFVNSFLPDYCFRQDLFGLETDGKNLPASDHFGVINWYTRDATPCHR